ncbi:GNAT family N-acetyltransferase [Streptomyces sp. NPDC006314]|uniref:GNAT family N-acetyltransferase n=1 Tax=Streptomyces sp. NPDC006314 TaxID=3154475 RepID=UPI0033AC2064
MLALLTDEERVVDPGHGRGDGGVRARLRRHRRGPAQRDPGPRRSRSRHGGRLPQAAYIPGLGKGGRAGLIEAGARADRRGGGLGRTLMERAVARSRARGCALLQLTSGKSRQDAHRFRTALWFARSHEGFRLAP